ncbi:MAG: hypothetical protein V4604_08095 [Bacteroidota bacterium]
MPSSNNYLTVILSTFVLTPILALFAYTFVAGKIHWSLALLLNVMVWWLYLELLWNTMVKITVADRTITVSKPFRKNSLLSRRKHHLIVIRDSEWDQLFYRHYKGSTSCYFRQERTAAYYFAADGFTFWTQDLQKTFPEKRFKVMDDGSPRDVVKALKRAFPERVL